MKKILIISLVCIIAFSACSFNAIEQGNESSAVSSDTDSDLFPKCSEEETKAFVETDEAFSMVHRFAWNYPQLQFDSADELEDPYKIRFLFSHVEELQKILGYAFNKGSILIVPQEAANELLFKYYGIENCDFSAIDPPFVDGEVRLPIISDYSLWDIDYLNLEKIDGNKVTYKYCFHFSVFDDLPGPFQTAYMTFEALKDEGQIFFRLISQHGLSEEFDSIDIEG